MPAALVLMQSGTQGQGAWQEGGPTQSGRGAWGSRGTHSHLFLASPLLSQRGLLGAPAESSSARPGKQHAIWDSSHTRHRKHQTCPLLLSLWAWDRQHGTPAAGWQGLSLGYPEGSPLTASGNWSWVPRMLLLEARLAATYETPKDILACSPGSCTESPLALLPQTLVPQHGTCPGDLWELW